MGPGTYTSMTQGRRPISRASSGAGAIQAWYDGLSGYAVARRLLDHGFSRVRYSSCLPGAQLQAAKRAIADADSPVAGASIDNLEWVEGHLRRCGQFFGFVVPWGFLARTGILIEAEGSARRDPEVAKKYSMHSFGAVFAEVSIDPGWHDQGTASGRRLRHWARGQSAARQACALYVKRSRPPAKRVRSSAKKLPGRNTPHISHSAAPCSPQAESASFKR